MLKKIGLKIFILGIFFFLVIFYGERGRRYVFIEVGHVGQNIYLQAETLGLATVAIGAFTPLEKAIPLQNNVL